MKQLLCLIALACLSISLTAAPKFPFPQNVTYPYGIKPATADNAKVQKAFDDFMKLYVEEGDLARIQYDNVAFTVSEGIGYGMMILVYMDNATNNTQAKFDKLWKYYNKFLNTNGLMNWKINGFSSVDQKNAATDAEVDVAVGLLQAYKQWGDEKYLVDAKSLIDKISKFEVNANGYLKPGDTWDMKKNPSYFSTAALENFKQVSSFDWGKVIANSYSLIKKVQNTNTGLVPAWCTEQGTHLSGADDTYQYDATRVPWRLAWAYTWYGHQDAKDICTKMASWIASKTANDASKIVDGYNLDGTTTNEYNNATFVGPFACAGLVDATHQAWLDNAYTHLNSLVANKDVYFQQSLKIITLLLLSGNMPNFWNTTGVIPASTSTNSVLNSPALSFTSSAPSEISFSITNTGHVKISFYTISGKIAAMPVNASFSAGNHHVSFSSKLPAGAYIVRMNTAAGNLVKRITIAE